VDGVTATLPVSEIFGPTLQGEGPAAGRCATFVRFMGCNLSCSWCDTAYTWDATRHDLRAGTTHLSPAVIAASVTTIGAPIVVLTGGEPLLNQDRPGWTELLGLLVRRHRIHLETNGTELPNWPTLRHAETICVSPKLANAGKHRGHQDPTLNEGYTALAQTHKSIHLKVVCQDADDVTNAAQLAIGWPPDRVWVMPEGTTPEVLAQRWPIIAEAAARHRINATHRLHVLAWGDERGH
jgi:7-carboxy-7-deazaguanine synthase